MLVSVLLRLTVGQLLDGDNDIVLELVAPVRVQLVNLLILLDDVLLQVGHELDRVFRSFDVDWAGGGVTFEGG